MRLALTCGVLLAGVLLGGCAAEPKVRLGALPFRGMGLYSVADPEDLGEHRYRSHFPFFDRERERGIIYTKRCGFIDISHVRSTADQTRLATLKLQRALAAGDELVEFRVALDRTRVHLNIDYPTGWYVLSRDRQQELIFELALGQSQRVCNALGTWHEIITWLGYETLPLISEKHSAFTYDDTVAHLIGVRAAGRALQSSEADFDRAMTAAIDVELARVGAVGPAETRRAVEAVRGSWWRWGRAIKRHLDPAVVDGHLTPMLVPGFEPADPDDPQDELLLLPSLTQIDSGPIDPDRMFTVRLQPEFSRWRRMREVLPDQPAIVDPEVHLPMLVEVVRQQMREEIGPDVDSLSRPAGIGQVVAEQRSDIVAWIPLLVDDSSGDRRSERSVPDPMSTAR